MSKILKWLRAFARYLPLILGVTSALCIAALVYMFCVGIKPVGENTDKLRDSTVLSLTPDGGDGYITGLVFLADSSISPIASAMNSVSPEQIWTGSDGHFDLDSNTAKYATIIFPETGEELTVAQALERKKPPYLIISIGVDNGTACTEESFKAYYNALIKKVRSSSPDTQIILQSILPVSRRFEKNSSTVSQKKIDQCNIWITELASQNKVKYVDSASALKGLGGYLNSTYDGGNGVSLNDAGYEKLLSYLRTHVYN